MWWMILRLNEYVYCDFDLLQTWVLQFPPLLCSDAWLFSVRLKKKKICYLLHILKGFRVTSFHSSRYGGNIVAVVCLLSGNTFFGMRISKGSHIARLIHTIQIPHNMAYGICGLLDDGINEKMGRETKTKRKIKNKNGETYWIIFTQK